MKTEKDKELIESTIKGLKNLTIQNPNDREFIEKLNKAIAVLEKIKETP